MDGTVDPFKHLWRFVHSGGPFSKDFPDPGTDIAVRGHVDRDLTETSVFGRGDSFGSMVRAEKPYRLMSFSRGRAGPLTDEGKL